MINMKNLIVIKKSSVFIASLVVAMLFSVAANAQFLNPVTDPSPDSAKVHQKELRHDEENKYEEEVTVEQLPEGVTSAIAESFTDYEISKVYQAYDGSFKVKLEKGGEKINAFYSVNGELLRKEKQDDEKEK